MYTKGKHVQIKKGTILESGKVVNNWAGEIFEVLRKEKCCLIMLDTQSIESMNDEYLMDSIFRGVEPFEYVFSFDDLELSERRDNDEDLMKALDGLAMRVSYLEEKFEEAIEEEMEEEKEQLIQGFNQSEFFEKLSDFEKEHSEYIISTFIDIIRKYEMLNPKEWNPNIIRKVCLEIVPSKIVQDIEVFEIYGDVLQKFFKYLSDIDFIDNAEALIKAMEQVKRRIPIKAKNPKNWSVGKQLLMEAEDAGVDFENEEELHAFMMARNQGLMNLEEKEAKIVPIENTYKGIGRNQRITVKYKNGEIKEDIKFKKVEQDLIEGRCELIKK